ncbi:MAG: urea ABC transporter ATP-binding subunit UrtE [Alphaproteobacteria bacterium]|nr:urea ABC transporter ATP-binding subunit UrtE [Alphaproteobacteria bacterium]
MLSIEKLNLFYGASHCLRDVDLTVEKGKVTCVLGRNGVGKSSLLRAIVGIERARSGSITWEGDDVTRLPSYQRARRGIGYVPQGREIFPLLTVAENLETGLAAAPRGMDVPGEVFDIFPVLRDMLRRRGGDLSGGQQQQLAIARALTMRPRLLILDEPTEGIQPSIIKDIERVIRMLAQRGDMAILLVEQYFEFARDLADQIAVMVRGEFVLKGPASAMNEEEVRKHLTV